MFIAAILWGVIVGQLASTTKVYQECKEKTCTVEVKKIGYEIVVEE